MYKFVFFILLISHVLSCHNTNQSDEPKPKTITQDTTPKVTGIGGIFFKSSDPAKLKKWYGDNLGLSVDAYGSPFEFRNAHRPDEKNYLNWDAFSDTTDYFDPSDKEFMINYRVQYIEALVQKLQKNNVTILDSIVTYSYGKFVHIIDDEGNKIELWEPIDSVLTTMGRKTTK